MPQTMKAAVAHKFCEPLVLEEVPIPEPKEDQVLIRVVASGVCHTDLHAVSGDWPLKPQLPFIPGHEVVGYVAAVGSRVSKIKEGDRVGVPWLHFACGECEFCISGWESVCPFQKNTGYSVNGGFAEYIVAPAAYVVRIPDGLDYTDAAPILCAGVTSYKGLKETEAKPGDWVVISGIGGLGHIAVQYAKAMGFHVIALARSEEKLDLARQLGAEIMIDVTKEDPGKVVQEKIGGAHGALVTAVSTSAFQQALTTLRRRGTCSLVGVPPGHFPTPIFDVILKCITIRGSLVGTRLDLQEALEFAAKGKVKAVVETQPLEAINQVFERFKTGKINGRIVLQFS